MNTEIFGYLFWYLIIRLCLQMHINKMRRAKRFLASCYWFSRRVDQRMNNKNTKDVVINIYCNYLQQNGELILNILQETIKTI